VAGPIRGRFSQSLLDRPPADQWVVPILLKLVRCEIRAPKILPIAVCKKEAGRDQENGEKHRSKQTAD